MLAALKFLFATLILAVNTLVLCSSMIPFALAKLVLPITPVRHVCDRALMGIAALWMDINNFWLGAVNPIRWQVSGVDGLDPRGWYLVASNHQTWVDILVLQRVFNRRIPMLKFFTKKELLYVPVKYCVSSRMRLPMPPASLNHCTTSATLPAATPFSHALTV